MPSDFVGGEAGFVVGSICIIMHGAIDFGGQNDFLTSATALVEPASDNFFGKAGILTPAIDVSGIKKVHACIKCCVHNAKSFFLICSRPEIHGTQTDSADLEA